MPTKDQIIHRGYPPDPYKIPVRKVIKTIVLLLCSIFAGYLLGSLLLWLLLKASGII